MPIDIFLLEIIQIIQKYNNLIKITVYSIIIKIYSLISQNCIIRIIFPEKKPIES